MRVSEPVKSLLWLQLLAINMLASKDKSEISRAKTDTRISQAARIPRVASTLTDLGTCRVYKRRETEKVHRISPSSVKLYGCLLASVGENKEALPFKLQIWVGLHRKKNKKNGITQIISLTITHNNIEWVIWCRLCGKRASWIIMFWSEFDLKRRHLACEKTQI